MHSVTEIAKPRIGAPGVQLLDPGIRVTGRGDCAADADPVLRATVLERDLGRLILFDIGEFLAVTIGQKEEVRSRPFGNDHGARDGTYVAAYGGEEANLETINSLVEFLNLLSFGRFVIPLLGNGRVGLGIYL